MIRAVAAILLAFGLAACDAATISGIASGVGRDFEAPRRPLAEPETATFAFLPFSGIPGNVGDNMLRRIWKQADREGLKVVKRPDGAALFTVEGVLTAISDDTNSLVFFVFDVKDVTGRRLHRISGQQRSEESAGDPWSNVSNRDLDKIAERLVALLRAWLNADEHPMGRLPTMAGGGNAPG